MRNQNAMTTFFISDTHFGHKGIIKHCNRPFADAAEMDTHMIAAWNSTVSKNDTVFHLGDFSYRGDKYMQAFHDLNGNKHLVWGNHDSEDTKRLPWKSVQFDFTGKIEGVEFHLYHYPLLEWHGYYRNSIHLYGHVHNTFLNDFRMPGKTMNVGVEGLNYFPISLEEVVAKLSGSNNYEDRVGRFGQENFRPKNMPGSQDEPFKDHKVKND